MKGRNGPTAFLPLSPKLDGQGKGNYPSIGQYLTRKQSQVRSLIQKHYNKN